jgi:hypothetical protein
MANKLWLCIEYVGSDLKKRKCVISVEKVTRTPDSSVSIATGNHLAQPVFDHLQGQDLFHLQHVQTGSQTHEVSHPKLPGYVSPEVKQLIINHAPSSNGEDKMSHNDVVPN